jgi:hypothetical protein
MFWRRRSRADIRDRHDAISAGAHRLAAVRTVGADGGQAIPDRMGRSSPTVFTSAAFRAAGARIMVLDVTFVPWWLMNTTAVSRTPSLPADVDRAPLRPTRDSTGLTASRQDTP